MAHHHHHHHQLLEEREKSINITARQIMASSSSSSSLFCYPPPDVSSNPNIQTHLIPQIQAFDPNPDIYNLATGIEMIGFQSPNNNKPTNTTNPHHDPGPSKDPNNFYRHPENDEGGGGAYVDDESSLRTCVFPCEGHERPSQGLSLSLSSNNPSTIGLQSFELRHQNHHQRLILSSSSPNITPNSSNMMGISMMQFEMMRSSKYLVPTQELLNECCSLGISDENNNNKQSCDYPQARRKLKKREKQHWEFLDGDDDDDDDDNGGHENNDHNNQNNGASSSSLSHQSNLYGLNLLELQKRKTKLLGLLEELDRRYRHYCEQMKGVIASFEGVAGHGAANVYSSSASKAMSRHFRSLRDAIVGQIKATKKAMGEKEAVPGTTRGETPRLRILDQTLRQQRAFQQMTMMETHPWRPQRGLPERSVSILRAWLFEHFLHPYPSDVDKHILARQTGLTRSQVSNWFINARVRLWKPMVEQMYLEETKEEQDKNMGSSSDAVDYHQSNEIGALIQPLNDQKPTTDQLVRVEAESLSSIINTTTAKSDRNINAQNPHEHSSATNLLQQSHQFGRVEAFGSIDLDFPSSSSFHHPHAPYGTQNDNNAPQEFGIGGSGGGGNVSLTLGLQQHGGNGVGLAFSPASHGSLFYPRDQIEDCQPVHQYSLLDGDQGQNLPYRNLMGAQLLHDFA